MTSFIPSAPAAPAHAPQSRGGGNASAGEPGGSDFAGALSEAAGKSGDETASKGDAKAKGARAAARGAHHREGRDADMPAGPAETTTRADLAALVAERRVKSGERHEAPPRRGHEKKVDADKAPVASDAAAAEQPAAVVAREVLIALGADLTIKPDQGPSAADFLAELRKAATPAAPRSGAAKSGKADAGEFSALAGAELPDEAAAEIVSVRVVRQEKHFQPVMREAQHLLAIDAAAAGDDTPASGALDALTRPGPQGALQRESAPATAARGVETPVQVAAPTLATGEPMPTSVGVQIADRVQQALTEPAETAPPPPPPPSDPAARPAFAPAIRSIKLELNPASLGAVTITLTGGDDALRIHLEAELADTVGKVEQDRGALSSRLNGAGYAITELTVARFGTQGGETDQRDSGARPGASQSDGGSGASREGAAFSGDREGRRPTERQPAGEAFGQSRVSSRGVAAEHVVSGISYAGRFRPV